MKKEKINLVHVTQNGLTSSGCKDFEEVIRKALLASEKAVVLKQDEDMYIPNAFIVTKNNKMAFFVGVNKDGAITFEDWQDKETK